MKLDVPRAVRTDLGALAATRLAEVQTFMSLAEAGNTDKSAPVSTKNEHPDRLSITDKAPTLESIEEMA